MSFEHIVSVICKTVIETVYSPASIPCSAIPSWAQRLDLRQAIYLGLDGIAHRDHWISSISLAAQQGMTAAALSSGHSATGQQWVSRGKSCLTLA